MPQLNGAADGDDLGASDELLAFKDEGEQREENRNVAAERDLDDVKSSLVNESESHSSSDSEVAERRAKPEPPDDSNRARHHSQLLGEALRRHQESGLLTPPPPPYVGYPFFMIPDLGNLCAPYLANGALAPAARTYLPFQWPLLDVPGRAAMRDSATPTHLGGNVAMVQPPHMPHLHPLLSYSPETISPQRASPGFSPDTGVSRPPHAACYPVSPGGVAQLPHPLSWLQGQSMYPLAGGFSPATLAMNASMSSLVSSSFSPRLVPTPQPSAHHAAIKQEPGACSPPGKPTSISQQQQQQQQKEEERKPHIKKPLNAFMLYMREERPLVVAQCNVKESATINQILGQRWHSLSKDQQAKYYEMARKERLLHSKLYPGWSARDNYGKKKKRKRAKSETQLDALPEDLAPQPKRPQVAAVALDAPHTHALLTQSQAPPPHGRPPPPSSSSSSSSVSHLTHTHLSQASPASSLDSPATPTTALASPAAPAQTHTEHAHSSSSSSSGHTHSSLSTLSSSSSGHGGHSSPYAEQLQPLSLTTKPQRCAPPPRRPTPSSDTPPPPPFLLPPPSSSSSSSLLFRRGGGSQL